jgi:hypothetical protein
MAAKPLPEKFLREVWKKFERVQFNLAALARLMKKPEPTVKNWIHGCQTRLGMKKPKAAGRRAADESQEKFNNREVQRLRDQAKQHADETRKLRRELNNAEDFRKAVFGLVEQPITPPAWTIDTRGADRHPGVPILFASDFQWGETIKGNELDGLNEFNSDIASRRYKLLINKTAELCTQHMVNPKYPGIIYLRGGDMISGEIHADLRESNDKQAHAQVKDLVEHEAWGIEQLLKTFGRVHVISVPGNHGRITVKPQSKGYAERNFDTLSAWWLESLFKNEKRVQFRTPLSGDAIFPVYGFDFLLTHGDRIGSRGGEGFIGAVATITRGMKKVIDYYASIGQIIYKQFIGHFHERLETRYGFANGSLPGISEYARDIRAAVSAPEQWLVFCHARYGVTARWPILLEPRPELRRLTSKEHVFAA